MIGGGIAGVASTLEAEGVMVYNERTKYNEWEFLFDLRKEQAKAASAMGGGMPGVGPQQQGQQGPPGLGTGMGTGMGMGTGSGFGSSTGFGSSSGFGSQTGLGTGSSTGFGQQAPPQTSPPPFGVPQQPQQPAYPPPYNPTQPGRRP
jgi:hypothetical protein